MPVGMIIRFVVSGALALAAAWLCAVNWVALVRRLTQPRAPSWVPIVAGLLGAAAMLVEPTGTLARFWWVAFLIDAGSAPGLVVTAIWLLIARKGSH